MSQPKTEITTHSTADRALEARILRRVSMHYADGADERLDRPAHVRAASSMAWIGDRVALVQDDVNFVALVDPATGLADAITLPAGRDDKRQFDDGRDNKKYKLDLEAMARVPTTRGTMLVAFGSGSKKRRENVLTLGFSGRLKRPAHHDPSLVASPRLYASLASTYARAACHFSAFTATGATRDAFTSASRSLNLAMSWRDSAMRVSF